MYRWLICAWNGCYLFAKCSNQITNTSHYSPCIMTKVPTSWTSITFTTHRPNGPSMYTGCTACITLFRLLSLGMHVWISLINDALSSPHIQHACSTCVYVIDIQWQDALHFQFSSSMTASYFVYITVLWVYGYPQFMYVQSSINLLHCTRSSNHTYIVRWLREGICDGLQ